MLLDSDLREARGSLEKLIISALFLLVFAYICSMTPTDQPTNPRRSRGRPFAPVPSGRDLDTELATLATWLGERPALKPATLSKAAGLHQETLGNMLRKYRRPQAKSLDQIYEALKPYKFEPLVNTNKNN